MASRASITIRLTAQFRYHLWSAGTTYQGADSVDVRVMASSNAVAVVVPLGPVVEVADAELPALGGVFEPVAEALGLLVLGDVEEDLDHPGADRGQVGFELVDELVAGPPDLLRGQLLHPDDEDVLVVGAVEDHHVALGRRAPVDPPQEVVGQLVLRGHAERHHLGAGRVQPGEEVLDGAVLAARVDGLEDDEERLLVFGEEPLLEAAEPVVEVGEGLGRRGLRRHAVGAAGVDLGEVDLVAGRYPPAVGVGFGHEGRTVGRRPRRDGWPNMCSSTMRAWSWLPRSG